MGTISKKSKGNIYHRAYTKTSRNQYWLNIVNKVPYKVDILLEFENEKECLLKETELITFYGYSWNKTGTLCNIVKDDKEIKYLARLGASKTNSKKVYQYSLDGEYIQSYDSIVQAKKEHSCDIYNACSQNRTKTAGGFQWRLTKYDKIDSYSKEISNLNNSKTILQYDKKGNFIKKWQGSKQPSELLNIHRGAIRNCLAGIAKTAGGYIWKY